MCKISDDRKFITNTTREDLNLEYLTNVTRNEDYFGEDQEAEEDIEEDIDGEGE